MFDHLSVRLLVCNSFCIQHVHEDEPDRLKKEKESKGGKNALWGVSGLTKVRDSKRTESGRGILVEQLSAFIAHPSRVAEPKPYHIPRSVSSRWV